MFSATLAHLRSFASPRLDLPDFVGIRGITPLESGSNVEDGTVTGAKVIDDNGFTAALAVIVE
ncbi:MAG: hypothetical protein WD042_10635 [Phycisphaeraceae bacterium]